MITKSSRESNQNTDIQYITTTTTTNKLCLPNFYYNTYLNNDQTLDIQGFQKKIDNIY